MRGCSQVYKKYAFLITSHISYATTQLNPNNHFLPQSKVHKIHQNLLVNYIMKY